MGDRDFVSRRANIPICIVENQILDMDKLAGHPHAGSRLRKMLSLGKPLAYRAVPDNLVEAGKLILWRRRRVQQGGDGQFREVVSHCFYGKRCLTRKLVCVYGSPHDIKKPAMAHR